MPRATARPDPLPVPKRARRRVHEIAPEEPPLARLRILAAGQEGQFATAQARAYGLERPSLLWLRERGEIVLLRRGVWRFRASAGDPDPAVTAYLACWPYGVIGLASAAQHHGLKRVAAPADPQILMAVAHHRKRVGMTVHVTRQLPRCDIVEVGTVAYTSFARTVCDLADPKNPWETLAVLDDAVAAGAKPTWIHARATALAAGRPGVRLVRDAAAPDAPGVFRSYLERASAHVYRCAGLPDPEWNVRVEDADGLIGIVDALWLPWRVIGETEGLRFHTEPQQRRDDARRFNRLCDAGYAPRRFTWEDVVHRPLEVAATIAKALRAAGATVDPGRLPRAIELPRVPFLR